MEIYNKYLIYIYEIYSTLKKLDKQEYDNNDLWKIFEYYSAIKLTDEFNKPFYEYNDIDPNFKELNKMSRNDTGIDLCDLDNTIVQCKLRKNSLTWKECSTFFGSIVIFDKELNKSIIRWDKLIITRNDDCILSEHLLERYELFIDKSYNKKILIEFCENLLINPPKYPIFNPDFKLRDYQIEAINMIKDNKNNVVINLPTGSGKNSVIIYSLDEKKKYLILVPRIILMEQLKEEFIKHKPTFKNKIQLIGDSNHNFDENKLITICVFNSIHLIEKYCINFEKIFIDEAHHIYTPSIYYENDDDILENSENEYSDEDDFISEDDSEDELVNVKKYTEIIKSLVKYKNNVYLSATIDKIDTFEYYTKDLRYMIDLEYLCDYQIHIPIFNNDPTNKNICEHLLKNYRNIIVYCNSQKEGKKINKLMNDLQKDCSRYIDCNTKKRERNIIIEKYNKGEISFLVNVRILVEGFDSPITKGVCFLHLPKNKTTLIQIIGRSLRLHQSKTIANIILPFSSKDDEKTICNFLKVIAQNDNRIKKSYENKKLGGYISIEIPDEEDENEEENDIEFKYNMIYNSMSILQNGFDLWINKLQKVCEFIDTNEKRPNKESKNKVEKTIGIWLCNQRRTYGDSPENSKKRMKTPKIYNEFTDFLEKYKEYFIDNNTKWRNNLKQCSDFIDKNNKRPIPESKNKVEKFLGGFLGTQRRTYGDSPENSKCIMKTPEIYNEFTNFLEKYKKHFFDNNTKWRNNLKQCGDFIYKNKKTPSGKSKNKDEKIIGGWLCDQKTNYGDSPENSKYIMKTPEIYKEFTDFLEKYKEYFIDNNTKWRNNLKQCSDFIDKNKKTPSTVSKNKVENFLGGFLGTQQKNIGYSPENSKYIMKTPEIYNEYTNFLEKYKEYFPKKDKKILPEILNKETLEKLNLLDIQNICKDKNIHFKDKDKKQILIEKINEKVV